MGGSVSPRHDPYDAVEEALHDGEFHEVIVSAGGRCAGLNSVPIVYATGNSAACVTVSGIPRRSATSRALARCKVVHTEPSPRDRNARTKLQAAGRIDPHDDAATTSGAPSKRRSMHGITITGTRSMVVASCSVLS